MSKKKTTEPTVAEVISDGKEYKQESVDMIPVKPNVTDYQIPFITQPKEFMMFGYDSLEEYRKEVDNTARYLRDQYNAQYAPKTEEKTEEIAEAKSGKKAKKTYADARCKASAASIIVFIFSLLTVAVIVLGKFVGPFDFCKDLLYVANGRSGLDIIISFFKDLTKPMATDVLIVCIAVTVCAVLSVLNAVGALVTVKKRGCGALMKISCFVAFAAAALAGAILFANNNIKALSIGLCLIIGFGFVNMLVAFVARTVKEPKQK